MIEAKDLTLIYHDAGDEVRAVDGVSYEIDEQHFVGIRGPSGSGKSSLLYLLAGLKEPQKGEVLFQGKRLTGLAIDERARIRRKHFGFVFQQSFLIPYLTLLENILTAGDDAGKESVERAGDLLESLDLTHARDRFPDQASAGEKQRAAIARAVFHRPEVVFADEPTASLDRENADRVIGLLRTHTKEGTLILVTHDETILSGADEVCSMYGGKLKSHNP